MTLKNLARRALMLAALSTAVAGAQANTLEKIRADKKIRVSIDLAVPPSGMMDASMKPTGSDYEVAVLLAKDLGVALEVVPTVGATRIPNLQTGKADVIISTLAWTAERAKVVDYSIPYAPQISLVGGVRTANVKSMADLAGKSVAVNRSTTQDTDLTQNAKGATVVRYDDDAGMITAVVTGQADLVATSSAIFQAIREKAPQRQLEPKFVLRVNDIGIGVRKDDPQLLAWINNWVKANHANGKLNEIFKKFHGSEIPKDAVEKWVK